MRILLLNGALGPDALLDDVAARLRHNGELRGATVDTVLLRIEQVASCQGCFECWTHTPGVCKINDAGRDLAREFVQADVVVLITPSHFGSYSSECKKVLDRTIGMLLPFFRERDGETHHLPRYAHRPAFGVLAVLDRPNFDEETALRVLVQRNAINFATPAHRTEIITRDSAPGTALAACDALLHGLLDALAATPAARETLHHPDQLLPAMARRDASAPPRRALVLVGSGKPRGESTSEALAMELLERLALRGVPGSLAFVHRGARHERGLDELLAAVRASDLLVIASPIYMDALPWLVTRALEAIATAHRQADAPTGSAPALPVPTVRAVAMLLNCGFPEARHAAVGRTIGALFARDIGAAWAGALQLGGGGMMSGRPLASANPLLARLAPALDSAADSLAAGERLSDFALQLMQEPLVPSLAYRAVADAGWLWTAAHEGALGRLWATPAAASASERA